MEVTLSFSQPFLLPNVPFPNLDRDQFLRNWAKSIPAKSELGPWKVQILQSEDVDARQDQEAGAASEYQNEIPFWRAFPLELAARLGRILYCRHTPDEAMFETLQNAINKHFPEQTGSIIWEQYYLDWGSGSSDVSFQISTDLSEISTKLKLRMEKFYLEFLYDWQNKYPYGRLEHFSPGVKAPTSAGGFARLSDTYSEYIGVAAAADPRIKEALVQFTGIDTVPDAPPPTIPVIHGISMAKGEYAFHLDDDQGLVRSRIICSVGVVLWDAVGTMATSGGPVHRLRRTVVSGLDAVQNLRTALALLSEAQLRSIELGFLARPARFEGDEFERQVYKCFWDVQDFAEYIDLAEREIEQSRALLEAPIAALSERQQWNLSVLGYLIAVLGLFGVIRDVIDTATSLNIVEGQAGPGLIFAIQGILILAALVTGFTIFRR